jgi:hypothetical protein
MPALPWTKIVAPEPDREYVAMASQLPLTRYRSIPSFLSATIAIRNQLSHADGLIGYALDAKLLRKTFWTVSVWESQEALQRFNHTDPHHARVERIRAGMQPTAFVFWSTPGSALPIAWDDARRRLYASRPQ